MIRIETKSKVLITGEPECGKSSFADAVIFRPLPRVMVWDPTGFFDERRGYRVIDRIKDLPGTPRVAYVPPETTRDDLDAFCHAAMRASNVMVGVDEPWLAVDAMTSSRQVKSYASLFRLGHKEAHNVGVCMMTHRNVDVPRIARMTNHRFFFRNPLPEDVEAARGYLGDNAALLARIPKYDFIHQSSGGTRLMKAIPKALVDPQPPRRPGLGAPNPQRHPALGQPKSGEPNLVKPKS